MTAAADTVREALEFLHGFEEAPDGDVALAALARLEAVAETAEARVVELENALREIAETEQASGTAYTPDEALQWHPAYGELAAARAREALSAAAGSAAQGNSDG